MHLTRFLYGAILIILCLIQPPAWSQNSILTISQGSGSGTYAVGATVHVWADPPAAGTVFDRWTGDTQFLLYPNAWHTTLVMPATGVFLRATYKNAPQWTPTTETISGVRVLHYVPPNPVGLIFLFHGRRGEAANMFNHAEPQFFDREAVVAGYGLVAPDSVLRAPIAEWNLTQSLPDNPDVRNVQAIVQTFLTRGVITAQTPLFAVGESNGAIFAPLAMLAVGGKAIAHMIGWGVNAALAQLPVPAIWLIAANDSGRQPDGTLWNDLNRTNFDLHVNRRNLGRFYIHTPSPVYPQRFMRIPGVTAQESETIYQAIKSVGLLDENNSVRVSPLAPNFVPDYQDRYGPLIPRALRDRIPDLLGEINRQLIAAYADHFFYSEANHLILELFDSAIGRRSAAAVVSNASYRPQAPVAPNSIVSVFGSGLAVATAATASINLPANLAGTTATVRNANVERPAQLFFVSRDQVNLLIPPDTALASATLQIIHATGRLAVPIQVARVAPGLYSANGSGRGAPAAGLIRVRGDGSQTNEPVAQYDAAQGTFSPAPLDFGPEGDRLVLILYGTGVRNPANPAATRVVFVDVSVPIQYAGPQNEFPGLDQINVEIPRSLAGRGLVDVSVVMDGVTANTVQLLFP